MEYKLKSEMFRRQLKKDTVQFSLVISRVLAKYECGIFSNFFSFSRFEIALREQISSENKECVLKMQTEEMRHMIGKLFWIRP